MDVGVGVGVEVLLVLVGGLEVVIGMLVVVVVLAEVELEEFREEVEVDKGTTEEVEDDSLKERYQFDRSLSPRHSPTVTPFHPFRCMRSKVICR